jgi:hypothetical protein
MLIIKALIFISAFFFRLDAYAQKELDSSLVVFLEASDFKADLELSNRTKKFVCILHERLPVSSHQNNIFNITDHRGEMIAFRHIDPLILNVDLPIPFPIFVIPPGKRLNLKYNLSENYEIPKNAESISVDFRTSAFSCEKLSSVMKNRHWGDYSFIVKTKFTLEK